MVKKRTVGILAIQGDVKEHFCAIVNALSSCSIDGIPILIKNRKDVRSIDSLIIPGGESTVISKFLFETGIAAEIIARMKEHTLPIMGTCAGCVLLAKHIIPNLPEVTSLNAMDISVTRNAFGSQKHSFAKRIPVEGFVDPYNAIFIRAPVIIECDSTCKVLARIDKYPIAVRQNEFLALTFHPELTNDLRIHEYFLKELAFP